MQFSNGLKYSFLLLPVIAFGVESNPRREAGGTIHKLWRFIAIDNIVHHFRRPFRVAFGHWPSRHLFVGSENGQHDRTESSNENGGTYPPTAENAGSVHESFPPQEFMWPAPCLTCLPELIP